MVCDTEEGASAEALKQERAFQVKGKERVLVWLEHCEPGGLW